MVAHVDVTPGSSSWLRLARRARFLAALTLIWLGIEGAVGVVAGILAGSIALVAFGLDSAIEGLASVIVIWRFTGTRSISADAERRAQKWVAISCSTIGVIASSRPHTSSVSVRTPGRRWRAKWHRRLNAPTAIVVDFPSCFPSAHNWPRAIPPYYAGRLAGIPAREGVRIQMTHGIDCGEIYQHVIPRSRLVVIENCGHMPEAGGVRILASGDGGLQIVNDLLRFPDRRRLVAARKELARALHQLLL